MTSCPFQINNGCHQFPSSFIVFVFPAILFFANSEYLAVPVDVFDQDALFCQLPIEFFLLLRQWFVPGGFERHLGVSKEFENPEKALIYFDLGASTDFQFALFENLKVVLCAARTADCKNDSGQKTDDH